ncbi:MAG: sugar ABC transporter ATP-binding protein [Lachnospiraceae bacterium]
MLELRNISKIFPGVIALDNVSISFREGEIHALMGENGAGKSTLMKIITGIYRPEQGEIFLDGKVITMRNFRDAVDHDINMVGQEIQIIPDATVAENIVLDRIDQYKKGPLLDWEKIKIVAQEYLTIVGLDIEPTAKIAKMTAAQKQLIQIAKALSSKAKYILLDEPTSSLTPHESQNLIKIVKKLKEQKVSIIFVSHKIEEVMELCDVVSVLRDGKFVGCKRCDEVKRHDIVKMMIGREESLEHMGTLPIEDNKVLEAVNATSFGTFENISFHLNKCEILGFYGLVGSGRTELARVLIGVDHLDSGEIRINGKKAKIVSLQTCMEKYKMGYVSENRKEEGLILSGDIASNISITVWDQITGPLRKISTKREHEIVLSMMDKMKVKAPSEKTMVGSLSGGNQQKVSIGKWLAADCEILIIDEPTVGVDVGAKQYIHELIWKLAKEEGKSIILISSDMPELIHLARRILVFEDQKIKGEIAGLNDRAFSYEEVSDEIGRLMA